MDAYLTSYVDSVMDAQESRDGIFTVSIFNRIRNLLNKS